MSGDPLRVGHPTVEVGADPASAPEEAGPLVSSLADETSGLSRAAIDAALDPRRQTEPGTG